jgi:tungstate transport system substrate-binding protein
MQHRLRQLATCALLAITILGGGCGDDDDAAADKPALILATTTSTQDSGLLDVLVPSFRRETGYPVKTIAVGSGEAIELGSRGEADVVLAHSPADEEALMATGRAGRRQLVMHNDFVLVGPGDDPARIRGLPAPRALERIAASQAPFVSRGDDSGTHSRELALWETAGATPAGDWYAESGQGMGATLRIALERRAYTLADRGTWLATGTGEELPVLVEGGTDLLNVYHVIDMTRRAGDRVNVAGARAFADWIVSPPVQRRIGAFGRVRYGVPLFTPDAGKRDEDIAEAA